MSKYTLLIDETQNPVCIRQWVIQAEVCIPPSSPPHLGQSQPRPQNSELAPGWRRAWSISAERDSAGGCRGAPSPQ